MCEGCRGLRVLHVIPSIDARDGGPSEAAVALWRALSDEGIETSLAFTILPKENGEFLQSARAMVAPSRSLHPFPRFGSESFKFSPAFGRWMRDRVNDFDVIHVHAVFSHSSAAAMYRARKARRPYIVRPLGNLAPYSLTRSRARKQFFLACGGRALIESAGAVHCTSDEESHEITTNFRVQRAFSVPNGVDDRLFEIDDSNREKVIVYIGRLHPKKNCESLIRAFATTVRDFPQWRLIIAGDGDPRYVRTIHALARPVGNIEFAGWVDQSERLQLLRRASLFVLPSAHENFGIAAAQAMAAGVPPILSEGVNLSSEVRAGEAGWVVGTSPAALATTMSAALSDSNETRRRAQNARRIASEKFRWSRVARQLAREYEAVTS